MHRRLHPLSESELGGTPSTWFLDTVLRSPVHLRGWQTEMETLSVDYLDRIARGGFPLAVRRRPAHDIAGSPIT